MKVYLVKLSVVAGIFCGIYAMLTMFFPVPMNSYLWTSFIGIAITFGIGPNPKKIPNFLCGIVGGIIWGEIFFFCFDLAARFGITGRLNMLVVVTILTFAACIVHLIFLANTWFDYLAVVFAGISCFFAVGGKSPILLILAMWLGVFLAISFGPVTGLLHKKAPEAVAAAEVDAADAVAE